ncbi:MAG: glycosyltransferase [Chloroflexota bacterium]|nr:glycosyltransferase [Chloroflexota bacterium]
MPFAAALRDAGHEVRVGAPASFASAVQRAGFAHAPLADAPADETGPVLARLPALSREEANAVVIREIFCGTNVRAALPAMQAVADRWRPDLVLRETAEFASYLVAERTGIPHAQVAVSVASFEEVIRPLVDEPLRQFGSTLGTAGLLAAPRLTLVPASLEDQTQPVARPTHRFRQALPPDAPTDLPRGWWPESRAPLVYVTFGSVAATVGFFPDFYRAVLVALADLPVRVLLTLGAAGDPERLGSLPSNVHVERWWPQEQVMPHAEAMVAHGGFGTTLLGLSAGIPMVVVPLFTLDQYANARCVQAVGAGVALEDGPAAPARVRRALEQVLGNAAYRVAARRVADEIADLPHPSECVAMLEALVKNEA